MIDHEKAFEFVKKLTGAAAVLYGLGLIVVRARLNALGALSSMPILDTKYLAEGWLFLAQSLYQLALFGVKSIPVLVLAWACAAPVKKVATERSTLLARMVPGLQLCALVAVVVPAVLLANSIFNVEAMLLPGGTRPPEYQQYGMFLLCLVAMAATWLWITRVRRIPEVFGWLLALLAIAFMLAVLPAAFAVLERSRTFLLADVELETAAELKNVLLLDESTDVLIVYTDLQSSVLLVPRKSVKRIRIHGSRTPARTGLTVAAPRKLGPPATIGPDSHSRP